MREYQRRQHSAFVSGLLSGVVVLKSMRLVDLKRTMWRGLGSGMRRERPRLLDGFAAQNTRPRSCRRGGGSLPNSPLKVRGRYYA